MTAATDWSARRMALIAGPVVYAAAITAYLWFGYPASRLPMWLHVIAWISLIGFPLATNVATGLWFDGNGFRTTGVRLDNLGQALVAVLPVALGLAVLLAIAGFALDSLRVPPLPVLLDKGATYAGFGPAQQFLINAYAIRQFRLAGLSDRTAIGLAAVLFALVHLPNLLVMGATAVIVVLFAPIFLRVPNIITLGLAHGALALCVYWMLPGSWHHNLAIGIRCCAG